jgi:hypothetical protein
VDEFLNRQSFRLLTPETTGAAVIELVTSDAASIGSTYMLNGAGLQRLP